MPCSIVCLFCYYSYYNKNYSYSESLLLLLNAAYLEEKQQILIKGNNKITELRVIVFSLIPPGLIPKSAPPESSTLIIIPSMRLVHKEHEISAPKLKSVNKSDSQTRW